MRQDEVEGVVYRTIAKQFNVPVTAIRADWSLAENLGADSYALIELMVSLEEAFQSGVPDALDVRTVGDIVNLAKNQLQKTEKV